MAAKKRIGSRIKKPYYPKSWKPRPRKKAATKKKPAKKPKKKSRRRAYTIVINIYM